MREKSLIKADLHSTLTEKQPFFIFFTLSKSIKLLIRCLWRYCPAFKGVRNNFTSHIFILKQCLQGLCFVLSTGNLLYGNEALFIFWPDRECSLVLQFHRYWIKFLSCWAWEFNGDVCHEGISLHHQLVSRMKYLKRIASRTYIHILRSE